MKLLWPKTPKSQVCRPIERQSFLPVVLSTRKGSLRPPFRGTRRLTPSTLTLDAKNNATCSRCHHKANILIVCPDEIAVFIAAGLALPLEAVHFQVSTPASYI